MGSLPRRQRVAAYAVILRERGGAVEILLSRLAPRVSRSELWTLPGGGVDHGEDPRDALIREVQEETGLDATVGDRARVYSAHMPRSPRDGQLVDAHAIRLVYEGWVPPHSPAPRVVEVDGTTDAVAWVSTADIASGRVDVLDVVTYALGAGRD
jgi:8-oxo-dGTP pyrophosphatase MutT (NUDIX family)